ncbi:hypothetical protein RsTz2092_08070 [Deferribacterales bacterium RsTz2092]|nr:hypothetical protein AGMMS49941_08690 [Deferribacterales bacterium]
MKKLMTAILVAILCGTAVADQNNTGCGVGTWLLKRNDDTKLMEMLIITTNISTSSQTTGIITGIEGWGCTTVRYWAAADMAEFVQANMDSLMRDISRGSGDTISSLAVYMNISDVGSFGNKLQQNFAMIFPTPDVEYSHVADTIYALGAVS